MANMTSIPIGRFVERKDIIMEKKVIYSKSAQPIIGPYVQAIQAGNLLVTSGQLGLLPGSSTLPDGIEAQTWQALDNMKALLDEAGYKKDDIIKITIHMTNMKDFALMNQIYHDFFGSNKPARVCVEVSGLPLNAEIMIDFMAVKD